MFKTALWVVITGLVSLVGLASTSTQAQTVAGLYALRVGLDGAFPQAESAWPGSRWSPFKSGAVFRSAFSIRHLPQPR